MKFLKSFLNRHPLPRLLILAMLFSLFLLIVLRAFFLSFTHDEAFTFLNYVIRRPEKMMLVDYTNNHLLNSIAMRWCYHWFGSSEFALRLPNVTAGLIYLVYCRAFVMRLKISDWWRLAAFACLTLNLAYFEFFSLARGYGISMGLLAASLYYTWRGFETRRFLPYATLSITFLFTAAYANYTLANYVGLAILFYASWLAVELIQRFRQKSISVKFIGGVLITGVATYFAFHDFLRIMLKLRALNNFSFGGEKGFLEDTVASVLFCNDHFFGLTHTSFPIALSYFAVAGVVLASASVGIKMRSKDYGPEFRFGLFLFYAISGCSGAIIMQHVVMHIPYSLDRTALYLLAFLVFFFVVTLTDRMNELRWLRRGVFLSWLLFPVVAFIANINIDRTNYWENNAGSKEIAMTLINDSRTYAAEDIYCSISCSFDQHSVLNYYLFRNKAWWLNPIHFQDVGFNRDRDYIIASQMNRGDAAANAQNLKTKGEIRLLKQEPKKETTEIVDSEKFEFIEQERRLPGRASGYAVRVSDVQSTPLLYDSILTEIGTGAGWQAEFYVSKISEPCDLGVVFSVKRGKEVIHWRWHTVYTHYESTDEWTRIRMNMYVDKVLLPGDKIDIYVAAEPNSVFAVDDFVVRRLF